MAPKVVSKQLLKAVAGLLGTATRPVSDTNYEVINLANSRYLDNAYSYTMDNNHINAWAHDNDSKEIWKFLTYPSSTNETIFTLQVLSTISQHDPSVQIDGRGGYMRAYPTNNTVVHGGQPQAWKLVEVTYDGEGTNIFMMSPFENAFSGNGTLFATDNSPGLHPFSPPTNQVKLLSEESVDYQAEQLWVFHEKE